MAVVGKRVTVAATATEIQGSDGSGSTVTIKNPGATTVALGGADVTAATGYELVADDKITLQLTPGESIYGIVAAATKVVHVLTTN